MTKLQYAQCITLSPAWDGADKEWLVKNCSKEELKDLFEQIDEAEEEYYSCLYG